MRLSPLQRKDIAEKLLKWLKDNNVKTCVKTDEPLRRASEEIDEHLYDLWKAFDLGIKGAWRLKAEHGCISWFENMLPPPLDKCAHICL